MDSAFAQTVLAGTGVFTGIILLLVAARQATQAAFVKTDDCKIVVNGDDENPLMVPAGSNLLTALASRSVFLPSACGGGGTCAMCKCQVLTGGGDILPTETGHINRSEQRENWRLSCQVKIREDMEIHVPDEIFKIQKWECTVRSNHNVATFIKELILELPAGENLDFTAGGYIQTYIPPYHIPFSSFDVEEEYHEDWDKFKFWDYVGNNDEEIFRAYSMANHPAEGNMVMLNVRIANPPPRTVGLPPGIASTYIFDLKPGDKVTISGPYGEFFAQDTNREMVYIGGGAGMAPMRSHLFDLFHTIKTGRKVSYWYGARSRREMFYTEDFEGIEKGFPNFTYHVALSDALPEDNWNGSTGFIHQVVLDEYLKDHKDPTEIEYYLCGPPMMIDAVQRMLSDMGVEPDMIRFDSFG